MSVVGQIHIMKVLFQSGVDSDQPVDVAPSLRGPILVPRPGLLRHAEAVAVEALPSLASGGPPAETHFHIRLLISKEGLSSSFAMESSMILYE